MSFFRLLHALHLADDDIRRIVPPTPRGGDDVPLLDLGVVGEVAQPQQPRAGGGDVAGDDAALPPGGTTAETFTSSESSVVTLLVVA